MSTTCSVGARTITVSGPLEDHVGAFADALVGWGFTEYSATAQLRVAADFSAWMDDLDVDLAGLTSELVDQYLERRRRRYAAFHTRLALRHLLGFLADWGLAAGEATGLVKPPRSELMEGFRAHLLQDRRLAWLTAEAHVARAARFVDVYAPEGVASLDAGILARAVIDEAKDHAPGSVQAFQATLRAFLRFCWLTRRIEHDLRGAVVPAGAPAGSRLPVGVSRSDMERLLLSCNRATAIGRRDSAVLVLLTALGLRAGEVAKLKLKDIDWLHGEILIRGKGSKEEQIGGAIGASAGSAIGSAFGHLGEALGKAVGSVLGSAIGGMFVSAKTGSVSLSSSGGSAHARSSSRRSRSSRPIAPSWVSRAR